MKRTLLLVVMVVSLPAAPASAREWTSRAGGFSVEAELVDVKDGNVVLKKTNGAQVSVPLNKLSLGDVRYINEVLASAEAAVTGHKIEAPAAEKPQTEPAPPPAAAAAVDLQKLCYQWKKGQSYIYRVKIKGDRGYYSDYYAGNVTYTVKSADEHDVVLGMTANMTRGERSVPVDVFVILGSGFGPGPWMRSGRIVRLRSDAQTPQEISVNVDSLGRVDHIEGDAQLPFLLGDLSQLMIEQLPEVKKTAWTVTGDPGASVITTSYPYYRVYCSRYRDGAPATEKTFYTVQGQSGKLISIAKQYELTTGESAGGKPHFKARGEGMLTFDTERGLPSSLELRMHVTVRETKGTEENSVRITYRLLSNEEVANAKKEVEEAKQKEELAKKEKLRPLTDAEQEAALVDLTSGDSERVMAIVKALAQKKPKEPNPKVAKALEPVALNGENAVLRSEAVAALKNWSTADNVPGLMKALQDQWPPVQSVAMEILCKYKPKEAIKPAAQLLLNMQTRGAAGKFIRLMGAEAEDAVLAQFAASKDAWFLADACGILGEIGTKKSIAPLEKAVMDENWMVNGNARKALAAIKGRQ